MTDKSNRDTAKTLENLATLMDEIGNIFGSRIEVHQVELYCRAAAADLRNDAKDSRELAEEMQLSTSAVSRNLAWFSHRGRLAKEGLNMIVAQPDAHDYRRKPLTLTPKGRRAAEALMKASKDRT